MFASTFPETIFASLKPILSASGVGFSDSGNSSLGNFLSSDVLSRFLLNTLTVSEAHKSEFLNTLKSLDPHSVDNVRIVIDHLVDPSGDKG
jgi:hypothetical protein